MINRHQILDKSSISEKGYTLVELMVVVVIIAVVAGLTMGEINSSSYRLKGAAQTLRAKMQQAKLLSVKENCKVYVDFDPSDDGVPGSYALWMDMSGNNDYNDATSDNNGDGVTNADDEELIEAVTLPQNIAFGAVNSGAGGPDKSASNSGSTAPTTNIISFSGDRLRFSPLGTGSQGWAYLFSPSNDAAGTYAIGSNNVGRIQTRKWVTNGSKWRGDGIQ